MNSSNLIPIPSLPVNTFVGNLEIIVNLDNQGWFLNTYNIGSQTLNQVILHFHSGQLEIPQSTLRLGNIPAKMASSTQYFTIRMARSVSENTQRHPMLSTPPPLPSQYQWNNHLFDLLRKHIDDNELRTLCFRLEVKYEDLDGNTFTNKVISLIQYCERHKRLYDLIQACAQVNTAVSWPTPLPEATLSSALQTTPELSIFTRAIALEFEVMYRNPNPFRQKSVLHIPFP